MSLEQPAENLAEKLITLPNKEEMLRRLVETDNEPHFRERFYPILLQNAGQERVPAGIVMMLVLAIYDYTTGMPPVMSTLMYMRAPKFIDALVDDPEVAAYTKKLLEKSPSEKQ